MPNIVSSYDSHLMLSVIRAYRSKIFASLFIGVLLSLNSHAASPSASALPLPPLVQSKLQQALYASGFRHQLPKHTKIYLPQEQQELYSFQVGVYLFDISADARFSMQGNVLEQAAEMQDFAEDIDAPTQQHADIIRDTLEALDESRMIVFAPEDGEVLHTITVFTDTSCPYSVEFHREIDLLTDAGVKVRYLGYPRMGQDSLGYLQMRPVWCSDQPQQAFNRAINRQRVRLKQCDSALDSHIQLGNSLGLMGTPTLLFEDGQVSTGYSSAIDILSFLDNETELPPASFSWVADFAIPDEVAQSEEETSVKAPVVSADQVSLAAKKALREQLEELWLKPLPWQQMEFTAEADFFSTTLGVYRFDVSTDGSFVMKMNLLDNHPQFTEAQRADIRQQALHLLDERGAIIFAPEQAAQHTVTIFTDANCRFCLSQYRETAYLNQAGVKVRYVAYPSAGLDSEEYHLLKATWCAPDRQKALLSMKLKGQRLASEQDCHDPIAAHYEFGLSLGVQGTPSIALDNGHLLPGYMGSDELLGHLQAERP